MYTLDTNGVLYYIGGDGGARALIDQALGSNAPLYVPTIVWVELFRYQKLSAEEEKGIRNFLSLCSVIGLDALIADSAGSIGRAYNLKLADSVIAATALYTGSTLLTRNIRDFRRVPSLAVRAI